jgi:hypothetical protein
MQTINKNDAIEITKWQQGSKEDMVCIECNKIVGMMNCSFCKGLLCNNCFVGHECD